MPRDRHQKGSVFESGSRVKKWKGSYYIYQTDGAGVERRVHREPVLGLKSELKKWEAEKKLQEIIDKETSAKVLPSPDKTLRWFWADRFLPMKEPHWKASSRPKTVRFVERYVLGAPWGKRGTLGDVPLGEITRFDLQMKINELALTFSKSVVTK